MVGSTRPSEAVTAVVGAVVGAALVIVGFLTENDLPTEVSGAIVTLVSFTAWGVTAIVAARQRHGALSSGTDGTVQGAE